MPWRFVSLQADNVGAAAGAREVKSAISKAIHMPRYVIFFSGEHLTQAKQKQKTKYSPEKKPRILPPTNETTLHLPFRRPRRTERPVGTFLTLSRGFPAPVSRRPAVVPLLYRLARRRQRKQLLAPRSRRRLPHRRGITGLHWLPPQARQSQRYGPLRSHRRDPPPLEPTQKADEETILLADIASVDQPNVRDLKVTLKDGNTVIVPIYLIAGEEKQEELLETVRNIL